MITLALAVAIGFMIGSSVVQWRKAIAVALAASLALQLGLTLLFGAKHGFVAERLFGAALDWIAMIAGIALGRRRAKKR